MQRYRYATMIGERSDRVVNAVVALYDSVCIMQRMDSQSPFDFTHAGPAHKMDCSYHSLLRQLIIMCASRERCRQNHKKYMQPQKYAISSAQTALCR